MARRRILRGRQRIPGDARLPSPLLDELASSYGFGRRGSFVPYRHPNTPKKNEPAITLPLIFQLLSAVLPHPTLTPERALEIIKYHIERNRIAKECHTKSWWRRHPKVKPKAPL